MQIIEAWARGLSDPSIRGDSWRIQLLLVLIVGLLAIQAVQLARRRPRGEQG